MFDTFCLFTKNIVITFSSLINQLAWSGLFLPFGDYQLKKYKHISANLDRFISIQKKWCLFDDLTYFLL